MEEKKAKKERFSIELIENYMISGIQTKLVSYIS